MANFKNYPIKAFSTNQKFLADDPNQVVRVTGQSMLDAAVAELGSIDLYTQVEFTNIATQTTITIDYLVGLVDVLLNGVHLASADYAATNGSSIELTDPVISSADIVTVIRYAPSSGLIGTGTMVDKNAKDYVARLDSVADIQGLIGFEGDQQISLKGWHPDSDVGGGVLYWDSAALKSTHNGGTIFSPTVPWTTTTADYLNAVGETDGAGTGVWVRLDKGYVTPEEFGAVGDGVTDDTKSCQAAISAFLRISCENKYYLTSQGLSHTTNSWYQYLYSPADREIFGGGEFISSAVFSNRGMMISIRGSNIFVHDLTFTNTADDVTQPWSVGVGFATNRDENIPVDDYDTVRIKDCIFNRHFLATSIFFSPDDSLATFSNGMVEGCVANGHPFGTGSAGTGAFDYHYTFDCSYFDNHSFGATFASAFNMVGVKRGAITGNYAKDNDYAGTQLENGTENITVSGNSFVNCRRAIWIDDSAKISVVGNSCKGGALGSRGVYITNEGIPDDMAYVTDGIVVNGNTLDQCWIESASFGGGGGGSIGDIIISSNYVDASGLGQSAIRTKPCEAITVSNNICLGGSDATISVNTQVDQITTVFGNTTKDGGDAGDGLDILSGQGERLSYGNQLENGVGSVSGTEMMNNDAGTMRNSSIDGFVQARGTGTPEGVLSANKGAIFQRSDGGAGTGFYVKESGTGNTGWIGK